MPGYKFLFWYGAIFMSVQIVLYLLLGHQSKHDPLHEDLKALNDVSIQSGIVLFIIAPGLLKFIGDGFILSTVNFTSSESDLVPLAVDTSLLRSKGTVFEEVIPALHHVNFLVETVYDNSMLSPFPGWPVSLFVKRASVTFVIRFFHPYEDNSWWFGSLLSDPYIREKAGLFGVELSDIALYEGILKKFRLRPVNLNGYYASNIWAPMDSAVFISDLATSRFLQCNHTRAKTVEHLLDRPQHDRAKAAHFTHKIKKLLTVVKTVFDAIGIPFWISSGTCLGYFRHCTVIPHSKDVDIGIFAKDFSEDIISGLEKQRIRLHLWFGELNDSMELSFLDTENLKLDIFFFYQEGDTMWNGGTQLRTGRKFKYVFPKFDLCWTIFLDLKVRVPCDTETYIKANYGPSWNVPVVDWDWKKSPFNVKENGFWPEEKRKFVMRVFQRDAVPNACEVCGGNEWNEIAISPPHFKRNVPIRYLAFTDSQLMAVQKQPEPSSWIRRIITHIWRWNHELTLAPDTPQDIGGAYTAS